MATGTGGGSTSGTSPSRRSLRPSPQQGQQQQQFAPFSNQQQPLATHPMSYIPMLNQQQQPLFYNNGAGAFPPSQTQAPPQNLSTQIVATQTSNSNNVMSPMVNAENLADLLKQVAGPHERISPALLPLISRIADEFVDEVAKSASSIASHRHGIPPGPVIDSTSTSLPTHNPPNPNAILGAQLEAKDVRQYLELHWSELARCIPTGSEGVQDKTGKLKREMRVTLGTEAHRARLAAVRRASRR